MFAFWGSAWSVSGTNIAKPRCGSSSSTVRNRNLFCSEQLKDAELNAENGREDGGPAFHSKQSYKGEQADVASIEEVTLREATDSTNSSKCRDTRGRDPGLELLGPPMTKVVGGLYLFARPSRRIPHFSSFSLFASVDSNFLRSASTRARSRAACSFSSAKRCRMATC